MFPLLDSWLMRLVLRKLMQCEGFLLFNSLDFLACYRQFSPVQRLKALVSQQASFTRVGSSSRLAH